MANQTIRVNTSVKLKTNLRGVLTLHEALKILSMPALDLRETVQGYLASNPILEEQQEQPGQEAETEFQDKVDFRANAKSGDDSFPEEQIKSHEKTIRDILLEEPQLAFDDGSKNGIKEFLIGNIDDDGYLLCTSSEVAGHCGTSVSEVEDVLKSIQEAAPPGVGARTPQEALLIQIRRGMGGEDKEIAESLVQEHFMSLKKRKFGEVASILGTTPDKVYELWDRISRFSISPGANYAPKADYVTPEITVRAIGDQLHIATLRDGIPNIAINQEYVGLLKESKDEDATNYLREKMQEAKWLIKAIDQRKRNILRIVTEVARVQQDFFLKGSGTIRPLTLRDVADTLKLSPSTISRAINSKYILTPYGTFSLKHFFTGGFSNGKTKVSNITVKEVVKELSEEGLLTDKEIADSIGKKLGIKLSRRAVAQYRNGMNIPSSVDRKKRLSKEVQA